MHLGTLGTGNHFIELCLDESERVWVMLHSGSRGIGNRIGSYFIELAKEDMRQLVRQSAGPRSRLSAGGHRALSTTTSRRSAGRRAIAHDEPPADDGSDARSGAIGGVLGRDIEAAVEAVNCHHNYVAREHHFGENVWVTRKGAVRARLGDLGIIPGSMGARSYIVRGMGNPKSFKSCSHGAGRAHVARRGAAALHARRPRARRRRASNAARTPTSSTRRPAAYKPIDAVMAAQTDLVEVVHKLHQVVCVKG